MTCRSGMVGEADRTGCWCGAAPPPPCTSQTVLPCRPALRSAHNEVETDHMTEQTITVAGARGGSGTSTVAAAIALLAARHASTELVAADLDTTAALLGLTTTQDGAAPIEVVPRLTLTSTPSGSASIAVVDAQRLDQLDRQPEGPLLVVLRGPCYLGLRSIVTTSAVRADGLVLVMELGRSLTRRDASDVCDMPVAAEIAATAQVARSIDAGLLVTRMHRLSEFTALARYVNRLLASRNHDAPARDNHASDAHTSSREPPSKIVTDLPGPLSRPGRELRRARARQVEAVCSSTSLDGSLQRDAPCAPVRRHRTPDVGLRSCNRRAGDRPPGSGSHDCRGHLADGSLFDSEHAFGRGCRSVRTSARSGDRTAVLCAWTAPRR